MRFTEADLSGAYLIDLEPHTDDRGFFARTFCAREFTDHGLVATVVQANLAWNRRKGTLRGLHYQEPPAAEAKLVRCTRGAVLDVIVDLRPDSPTYRMHTAVELTAANRTALFVPELFAHGYQTLANDTEVAYQVSAFYTPGAEQGLRFDDRALDISWPLEVSEISDKDRSWPLLESA